MSCLMGVFLFAWGSWAAQRVTVWFGGGRWFVYVASVRSLEELQTSASWTVSQVCLCDGVLVKILDIKTQESFPVWRIVPHWHPESSTMHYFMGEENRSSKFSIFPGLRIMHFFPWPILTALSEFCESTLMIYCKKGNFRDPWTWI